MRTPQPASLPKPASIDPTRFGDPTCAELQYVRTGSRRVVRSRTSNCALGRRLSSAHAVEWWATGVEQDGPFTLPGCLLLRFHHGGLCEELREYWHLESERREPPDGWGV